MNKLDEIFKNKPELRNTIEVNELIDYVQNKHQEMYTLYEKFRLFHLVVEDCIFSSELFIINGIDSNNTLEHIMELVLKF